MLIWYSNSTLQYAIILLGLSISIKLSPQCNPINTNTRIQPKYS